MTTAALEMPKTGMNGYPGSAQRALRAVADKYMIIGLDGATFDVLTPLMDQGRMPNLKRFCEKGVSGVLMSTRPPITPAAWTTFMTGKGPGRHGILDFESYDAFTHTLAFNSQNRIREKTIWDILSEKGLRVGSINVPMTFPPKQVNGFVISGFETPSIDADFTYPRELKQEIFKEIPSYNYRTNWKRKTFGGDAQLAENLEYISNSFDQGWELTRFCGNKYGWDVLMVLFKLVDNLQHKAWKYLDPRTAPKYPARAEMVANCFARLDRVLGDLFEYAEQRKATVLIMSDHGHGSLDAKAQPNYLLREWGFLRLKSAWEQASTRTGHLWHRLTKGRATRFEQGSRGIERDLAVDWSQTRACVMHAGIYGFLYVNLKGRGPHGIVDPSEYDALRHSLIEKFQRVEAISPRGERIRVFPNVYKTEELYACKREDNPYLPDLLLAPYPGVAVVRKIRGNQSIRWCSEDRMEGTHREEGVLAVGGPNVRKGERFDANIVDIAPTILASMGLRVPLDMEGKVMREVFAIEPSVEREPPLERVLNDTSDVYSEEDKKILEKRLGDLGYLE